MVLKFWDVIGIFGIFIGIVFFILHIALRSKNKKVGEIIKDLHFELINLENIPALHKHVSTYLRYFWSYEFLTVKTIDGIQVYFIQYLEKKPSRHPYTYALVSLFQTPLVFINNDERFVLQKEVSSLLPGAILTQNGIFYYHAIPWNIKKSTIELLTQNIIQAVKIFEK